MNDAFAIALIVLGGVLVAIAAWGYFRSPKADR